MTRRSPRHLQRDHAPRPRASAQVLATLAARLTPRDRYILRTLHEHRVLTTAQVDQLAFGNDIAARHRMLTLYRLGATDRFRPWVRSGSSPWHHVLAPGGAAVLAAEDDTTVAALGYRHDTTLAIAHATTLGHTVGVNGFFTALAACARAHPGCELLAWWSERRCASHWGDLVRPDAYGRWRDPRAGGSGEVEFFLEHDTGTEPLYRVAGKLAGYHDLTAATGITTPVLFHLPSAAREANLRRLLDDSAEHAQTPIATATPHAEHSPAGPIWLPARQSHPRVPLADLTQG